MVSDEWKWIEHIENEIGLGHKASIPDGTMSLDSAVNLAIRLKVTLTLANSKYLFSPHSTESKSISD